MRSDHRHTTNLQQCKRIVEPSFSLCPWTDIRIDTFVTVGNFRTLNSNGSQSCCCIYLLQIYMLYESCKFCYNFLVKYVFLYISRYHSTPFGERSVRCTSDLKRVRRQVKVIKYWGQKVIWFFRAWCEENQNQWGKEKQGEK